MKLFISSISANAILLFQLSYLKQWEHAVIALDRGHFQGIHCVSNRLRTSDRTALTAFSGS